MDPTRRVARIAEMAGGVAMMALGAAPHAPARMVRDVAARVGAETHSFATRAPGIVYHLARRHPDPDVADDVLADRIRSSLGRLERHLDVPHVHVMVTNHVVLLHGDVPSRSSAIAIERAVLGVSGVEGIESHLHPQLERGDTRPSESPRRLSA